MDADMEKRLDQIVEDEIQRGYRIRQVPNFIVVQLRAASAVDPLIRPFSYLRFSKPTPRKRRLIQEMVMERFNQDLKNDKLLSTKQLRDLTIARGEWSLDDEKTIDKLTQQVTDETARLAAMGVADRNEWSDQIRDTAKLYMDAVDASDKHPDEKAFLKDIFTRWSNYMPTLKATYTELYASKQGTSEYDPDKDLGKLMDTSPSMEASNALMQYDDLLGKIYKLSELLESRQKLAEVMTRKASIFSNSIESRREQCEELANIYYTTEVCDESGKVERQLTPSFDGVWDFPDTVIRWLIEEFALFQQNVPDALRGELEDLGFLGRVPEIGTKQPSDELLEAPSSKPDSQPVAEMAASSSE